MCLLGFIYLFKDKPCLQCLHKIYLTKIYYRLVCITTCLAWVYSIVQYFQSFDLAYINTQARFIYFIHNIYYTIQCVYSIYDRVVHDENMLDVSKIGATINDCEIKLDSSEFEQTIRERIRTSYILNLLAIQDKITVTIIY